MTLPDYRVRYSKKARYLHLRISKKGLEVVVPFKKRVPTGWIEQFIQKKSRWILRHTESFTNPEEEALPRTITLTAFNQCFHVSYLKTTATTMKLIENPSGELKLMGDTTNKARCIALLKRWLKKSGEVSLSSELTRLSEKVGLPYHQLTIRNNLTRWGSCTVDGSINLDCKLLFLPSELMNHVMLHELSHTLHMNHGKGFWNLLKKLDPDTVLHVKQLKSAKKLYVPWWV